MKSMKEHDVPAIEHGAPAHRVPWITPGLVCFGAVKNLTAAGSINVSETFTSSDGGLPPITSTTYLPYTFFHA